MDYLKKNHLLNTKLKFEIIHVSNGYWDSQFYYTTLNLPSTISLNICMFVKQQISFGRPW